MSIRPVDLRSIRVTDGDYVTLDVESLMVEAGEKLVVFGPNGAGKSTLLREVVDRCGSTVSYLPQRRYMFRGYGRRNLTLGLSRDEAVVAQRLAQRLGVADKLDNPGNGLSGGEKQRLALARVLARASEVVCLDEPLSAVDVRDRDALVLMVGEAIGNRAAIVVTHEETVAAAFADRVSVMIGGRIRQTGTPTDVFAMPQDVEVAAAVGRHNVIVGKVTAAEAPLVKLECGPIDVWAVGDQPVGDGVRAVFGAETVVVSRGATALSDSARNRWKGTIVTVDQMARLVNLTVDVGIRVSVIITAGSLEALELAAGDSVVLSVKATAVRAVAAVSQ